jgi:nicotinate-nucleotide pyrophosphorylase (carboxylating)
LALAEDIGPFDLTSRLTVPQNAQGQAKVVARTELVVSGLEVLREVFRQVDPAVKIRFLAQDGETIAPKKAVVEIAGPAQSLLTGERVALNFLSHLSGIATLTRRFILAMGEGPDRPRLLATRKTTPGLRALEKAAVVHGGGFSHRFGLFDGIMLKDNHIAAVGSLTEAVVKAKSGAPHGLKVEVEVDSAAQIEPALKAGADILLLDNFTPAELTAAVSLVAEYFAPQKRAVLLEASGGINLKNLKAIAETGVDFVSVGAITHSAPAADLGLDWS